MNTMFLVAAATTAVLAVLAYRVGTGVWRSYYSPGFVYMSIALVLYSIPSPIFSASYASAVLGGFTLLTLAVAKTYSMRSQAKDVGVSDLGAFNLQVVLARSGDQTDA